MSDTTDKVFNQAIISTLNLEGGYVDDPDDKGGATNFGITKKTAVAFGYGGDMRTIPMELVHQIYKQQYWERPGFDRVATFLPALAQYAFDIGVNCGPKKAVEMLQEAAVLLGQDPGPIDGVLGKKSLDALLAVPANLRPRIRQLLGVIHGAHYLEIVRANPSQRKFLGGWMRRLGGIA